MDFTTGAHALGALVLSALGGACRSVPELRLTPTVQDTELRGESSGVEARLVVAWKGVREAGEVLELRFRLRVENAGDTPFSLVPARFELLDGSLASLGNAAPEDLPVAVEVGGSAVVDLCFSVPGRAALASFDLSALTLQTELQAGRWSWSTSFQRVERVPYDFYPWGPYWHFHTGVSWHWASHHSVAARLCR